MGCLPLVVTTHFCLTRSSKRLLVGTDRSAIWKLLERHLTVLCINEIVPSYVVVELNNIIRQEVRPDSNSYLLSWKNLALGKNGTSVKQFCTTHYIDAHHLFSHPDTKGNREDTRQGSTKNPTIYNILRWLAGKQLVAQVSDDPSIFFPIIS